MQNTNSAQDFSRLSHDINRLLSVSEILTEHFDQVLEKVSQTFGWSVGLCWKKENGRENLTLLSSWFAPQATAFRALLPEAQTIKLPLDTPPDQLDKNSQLWPWSSAWEPDLREDHSLILASAAAQRGLKSMVSLPLMVDHKCLGMLAFYHEERRVLEANLLQTLEGIAKQMSRFLKVLEPSHGTALEKVAEQQRQRADEAEDNRKKQEQFIDTLCHELRNPLHGIYGSVSLQEDNIATLKFLVQKAGPEHLEPSLQAAMLSHLREEEACLQTIAKCARHQKRITDDVLNLSKLEAGKFQLMYENFNAKKIVEDVVDMLESEIDAKNIELSLNFSYKKDMQVHGDPNRLAQVLLNFLSNAIKFTPNNGKISIALSQQTTKENTEKVLAFSVEDTGIGLTADELAQLFKRFVQIRGTHGSEYEGSGLGLAISKNLVEIMGGEIKVTSTKGQGSLFSFSIPFREAIPEIDRSHTVKSSPPFSFSRDMLKTKRHTTLLIVEDSILNQRLLTQVLERKGYRYHVANHGKEAIEFFERYPIDLILMDIVMPIMGGLEATQAIRHLESTRELQGSGVVIIGLSGHAREEHQAEALRAGMNDYLVKPYHPEQLLSKIKQGLELKFSGQALKKPPPPTLASHASDPALVTQLEAVTQQLESASLDNAEGVGPACSYTPSYRRVEKQAARAPAPLPIPEASNDITPSYRQAS